LTWQPARSASIRSGLATGLAGQVLWLSLTMANAVLVIRLLGRQVGVYYLFTTTTSLLCFLMDPLGLKWSATYLVGRRPGRARRLLAATLLACATCGLAVLVAGPHVVRWIARLKASPDATITFDGHVGLLAVATFFNLMYLMTNAIILGGQTYAAYNVQQVESAGVLTLGLLGIHLARVPATLRAVLLLWTAGLGVAAVTGLIVILRRARGRPSEPIGLADMAPGIRAYAINSLSFLHQRVDFYMVSWLLGAARLGIYGTAVTMAEGMGRITAIVGPVVYSKSSADEGHELPRRIPGLLALVALSTMGLGLLFAAIGRILIPIVFGRDFVDAFVPTLALIPGVLFMGMTSVLNNFMSGKGYPPVLLVANLTALLVNVTLNALLITRLGVVGASVSSSVSYLCWFIVLKTVYDRHLRNARDGSPAG